jgi:hypothetical protein
MPYGGKRTSRAVMKQADRDRTIIDLATRGIRQADIATAVGITRQGVTKALKRISEAALRELTADVRHLKALQTRRLEFLYRESVAAWERSKGPAEQTSVATGGKEGDRTTTTTRGQCGDPRHLEAARAALGDIGKLWGLNAQPGDEVGGPVRVEIHYSETFFAPNIVVAPPLSPPAETESPAIDVHSAPSEPLAEEDSQ